MSHRFSREACEATLDENQIGLGIAHMARWRGELLVSAGGKGFEPLRDLRP